MKKTYLSPTTTALRLAAEGTLATSAEPNTVNEAKGHENEQFSSNRDWKSTLWE